MGGCLFDFCIWARGGKSSAIVLISISGWSIHIPVLPNLKSLPHVRLAAGLILRLMEGGVIGISTLDDQNRVLPSIPRIFMIPLTLTTSFLSSQKDLDSHPLDCAPRPSKTAKSPQPFFVDPFVNQGIGEVYRCQDQSEPLAFWSSLSGRDWWHNVVESIFAYLNFNLNEWLNDNGIMPNPMTPITCGS